MIKQLEIKNYQSHKHTLIEFDKSVNIIVGRSDVGKSVIIKAIDKLRTDRPLGTSFIMHGNTDYSINMSFYDNTSTIKRIKNNKENIYQFDNEKLKAINKEIPLEIQQFLNLSDINIQRQADSHFLISNTSGEVAKYLNKIVNIDQIDKSLSQIESLRRETTKKIDNINLNIVNIKNKLEEYNYIAEAENKFNKLQDKIKEIENVKNSYNVINELDNKIQNIKNKINEFSNINKTENKFNKLQSKIKEIENDKEIFNTLNNLKSKHNTIINFYNKKKEECSKLKNQLNELMPEVCPLCSQPIPK